MGKDGCALAVRVHEIEGAADTEGAADGKADADTEGAADGDDMLTDSTMGIASPHHPICVLHSTSPVA